MNKLLESSWRSEEIWSLCVFIVRKDHLKLVSQQQTIRKEKVETATTWENERTHLQSDENCVQWGPVEERCSGHQGKLQEAVEMRKGSKQTPGFRSWQAILGNQAHYWGKPKIQDLPTWSLLWRCCISCRLHKYIPFWIFIKLYT